MLSCFSHIWLFVTLWAVACQDPLSMGFSRQTRVGCNFLLPPGYLPDPGIEPVSPVGPALQVDSSSLELLHCRWIFLSLEPTDAAAKSPQSCLTLCDPIDGSPPGSTIPGILQARTLEWVLSNLSPIKWDGILIYGCQAHGRIFMCVCFFTFMSGWFIIRANNIIKNVSVYPKSWQPCVYLLSEDWSVCVCVCVWSFLAIINNLILDDRSRKDAYLFLMHFETIN